jgi:hypothetical protein
MWRAQWIRFSIQFGLSQIGKWEVVSTLYDELPWAPGCIWCLSLQVVFLGYPLSALEVHSMEDLSELCLLPGLLASCWAALVILFTPLSGVPASPSTLALHALLRSSQGPAFMAPGLARSSTSCTWWSRQPTMDQGRPGWERMGAACCCVETAWSGVRGGGEED